MLGSISLLTALILAWTQTCVSTVTVTTIAGTGYAGYADGFNHHASFSSPQSMTIDAYNNLYIVDAGNMRIRHMSMNGVVKTFAGNGGCVWVGCINGLAIGHHDELFVTEGCTDVVRKVTRSLIASVYAGEGCSGFHDGPLQQALFNAPAGIVMNADGVIFIADEFNHRIRKITPDGVVSTFAGSGCYGLVDGHGNLASFHSPTGLAMDAVGNVYVADTGNHCIRKITPNGTVSVFAGSNDSGFVDGPASFARFNHLVGVAVDMFGTVYVTDSREHCVRKITPDGFVTTVAGDGVAGFRDGSGLAARFSSPAGIAVNSNGQLFVADSGNHCIRRITLTPDNNSRDDDDDVYVEVDMGKGSRAIVPPRPIHYNKEECAICYEVKTEGGDYDYCSLGCGHTFHKQCIQKCMTRRMQRKCPICRTDWIMDKTSDVVPKRAS